MTLIFSLLCVSSLGFAAVIHVPAIQSTIQAGIDAAKDGDTVLVADGIYEGAGNVNIDFKGKRITVKSRNGAAETVINCSGTPDTRGFIFQNEETNDSVLDGFTISDGVHELGGGIYCNNASPTIKNCVITFNRATATRFHNQGGGGIYCFNSDAIIIGCTISKNSANSGAGVLFEGEFFKDGAVLRETHSQPSLINSTISANIGSGVFCFDFVNPIIRNCTVSRNSGRGIVYNFLAGGMNNPITNCRIMQNTGGGIECSEDSILKISNSIIKQNTAEIGGGIYCSPTSIIDVSECVIAQNIAMESGGGIGVITTRGEAKITHCTITRNSANESGGGVYADIDNASFTLTDSIIWGNSTNGTQAEFAGIYGKIVIRHCDIRDGLDGIDRLPDEGWFIYEDNIDADPLFVDADRGDYRLKPGSPAAAMGVKSLAGGVLSVTGVGKRLVKWAELKHRE